jgi:hypothetical protein
VSTLEICGFRRSSGFLRSRQAAHIAAKTQEFHDNFAQNAGNYLQYGGMRACRATVRNDGGLLFEANN